MKKLILLLTLVSFSFIIFAQSEADSLLEAKKKADKEYKDYKRKSVKDEDYNLFSKMDKETKFAIYFAFDMTYFRLNDSDIDDYSIQPEGETKHFEDNQAILAGLSIGASLNKHFVIGLWGFTDTEGNQRNDTVLTGGGHTYLRFGGGGIFSEIRIFPKIPIHFTLPIKGGFGSISYRDNNYNLPDENDLDNKKDTYFIFEPGVNLEINIVRFFKIAGGISYRFTDPIELGTPIELQTPSDILQGWNANLSLIIIFSNKK
jgi:hypothetical protein